MLTSNILSVFSFRSLKNEYINLEIESLIIKLNKNKLKKEEEEEKEKQKESVLSDFYYNK